eukprot:CAMPEP_0117521496 /NCGR_PEP_ID=MMETSP0784-20121206/33715_1 /TAXON_ID=39447 /ORGANISM="" /LENGTH=68 /DNA_ID=CAMNT_0005317525 /DNA_START=72 /DNA_END=276 /DNA_ORIENTATION=-
MRRLVHVLNALLANAAGLALSAQAPARDVTDCVSLCRERETADVRGSLGLGGIAPELRHDVLVHPGCQ